MGADSNYEANSKKVLGLYCHKTLPINLFWGTYRGYRQSLRIVNLLLKENTGRRGEKQH